MGKIDFNIGEFDTRITLCSPDLKKTPSGAVLKNFIPKKNVFGKVSVRSAGEEIGGESIIIIDVREIVTYDIPEMDNSWRLIINGCDFDILSVERLKRRYMCIMAKIVSA